MSFHTSNIPCLRCFLFARRLSAYILGHHQEIKLLNIDGIAPNHANIRAGRYPFTNDFYAVTVAGRESDNVRQLLAWVQSPQGQELVQKTGYVPFTEPPSPTP